MKNGELFEGDNLKPIWPTEGETQPFWWWTDIVTETGEKGEQR